MKVLLVKCYHPELKKYFAGYGYEENGKFYVRVGGGAFGYLNLEIGPEFEAVQGAEVEPVMAKALNENWLDERMVPESADKFLRDYVANQEQSEWEAVFPEEKP